MQFAIRARSATAIGIVAAALLIGCAENNPDALLASGKQYLAKKDNQSAVIQFKNALQARPNLAEARFLLGKTLLETGDIAGAEKELRKAMELNYPAEEVVPLLAHSLVTLGQNRKILEDFSATKLTQPEGNATLQWALGAAHLGLGNRDAAQSSFNAALSFKPDYAPARIGQAQIAANARDYTQALAELDRALAADPSSADAWHVKGDIHRVRGDRDGAISAYRKALEHKPNSIATHSTLVSLLIDQKDLDAAAKQLGELKRIAPRNAQMFYLQARLAHNQKNFTAARDAIQQYLKLEPDSLPGHALAAHIQYDLQSYGLAEAHLLRILQRAPDHTPSRQLLIATYLRGNDPGKALNALTPVLSKIEKNPVMLALAGETYMLNGDPQRAADYFGKAAALDPADHSKRASYGASLVATGQTERGVQELEQTAAQDSGIRADLALIATYMRQRDFQKALKAIAALEKKQPKSPAPHNLRGAALLATKDAVGARRSFERALELDGSYFPAIVNLARLDLSEKKPDAAEKRFETVLAKDPNNREALLALAELRARRGVPQAEVVGLISKAISAHPNDPGARVTLINYYIGAKEAKKAVAAAQDALAAMPDRAEIVDAAGRAYGAAGDTNQAISIYRKLASMQPKSAQPHLRLAEVHLAASDRDSAIDSLRKALSIQPGLLEAQRRLATLYTAAGKHEEAVAIAHQVQKQRPKQSVGYLYEGDIHASAKNWSEAAAAYRRGLKETSSVDLAARLYDVYVTSGDQTNAKQFSATWIKEHPKDDAFRLHLAQSAMLRQDYAAAVEHYRKLLDKQPNNALLLNNLAWASAHIKDPKALEYAEQAYKIAPDQHAIMDTLGILLVQKGETARGIELLRKASAAAPQSPDVRLNLAKALIKAGQKDEAKKELDQLAKLGQKFPRHAEVKQLMQGL